MSRANSTTGSLAKACSLWFFDTPAGSAGLRRFCGSSLLTAAYHALRWHDLRHTCAALSLEVQPNLAMVQARLGHEDIRTTINIYGHLLPSEEAALGEGLAATFNAADNTGPVVLHSGAGRV